MRAGVKYPHGKILTDKNQPPAIGAEISISMCARKSVQAAPALGIPQDQLGVPFEREDSFSIRTEALFLVVFLMQDRFARPHVNDGHR